MFSGLFFFLDLDCGKLPKISDGKAKLDKKSKSTVGTTATVKCDKGFEADLEK